MSRWWSLVVMSLALLLGSSSLARAQAPGWASYGGTITSLLTYTSLGYVVLLEVTGDAAHQIRARDRGIGNWTCTGTRAVRCETAYLRSNGRHLRPGEAPLGLVVAGPLSSTSAASGHLGALMHTYEGHDEWFFRIPVGRYFVVSEEEADLGLGTGQRIWRGPDAQLCPAQGGPLEGYGPPGHHAQFGMTSVVGDLGGPEWEYEWLFLPLTGCRLDPG